MIITAVLMALLAIQAGEQDSPYTLVQKALEKDARDAPVLRTLKFKKTSKAEDLDPKRKPKPGQDESDKDNIQITIPKLFKQGRYQYVVEGSTVINGRSAITLRFWPAVGQPGPDLTGLYGKRAMIETGLNQVINRFHGILYLDQETLGIVRFEAHLTEAQTIKAIFTVYQTDITYEQAYVSDIWAPKAIVSDVSFSKFFGHSRKYKRFTITFENYQ